MLSGLSSKLDQLFRSLPARPIPKDALDAVVIRAVEEAQSSSNTEIRKAQWELLLRNRIYDLASGEEFAMSDNARYSQYYEELTDSLDIVLTFAEHGACDSAVPFTVLEELLETQTISSCSHIFAWIEKRRSRLTVDMVPQKGKALVLLRTLNDLLRRLSKTGDNTKFCGRILTFLSAVFPLGERSGVNLRGEYAAQWEPVTYQTSTKEEKMDVDEDLGKPSMQTQPSSAALSEQEKAVESSKPGTSKLVPEKSEEGKEDFYNTFWWLQMPFSRPSLFVQSGTLEKFKAAVNTVMPVIKEATIKERAMMGSKAVVGSLKRKRESTPTGSDDANRNYLFARFLTSPELLDLEIADTHFRRQFLFQLLILLSHLLQFTQTEKVKWATQRNRSLQMDFTLEAADAKWAQETMAKVYEELRQTAPNGRAFAETVQTILERENNWIKWKNDLCSPFDRDPLQESLEKATASVRKRKERAPEYQHKLGSKALSEIWALGYKDPTDLQMPFRPGDVKSFVREIERENARIKMRRAQIEKQLQAKARAAAANNPPPVAQATVPATAPANETTAPTIVAPAPQRPQPVPVSAPAASPPLHPSLPAKPSSSLKPPQRPTTPVPTASPSTSSTPVPTTAQPESKAPTPAPTTKPIPTPQTPEISDPQILRSEENKLRISWLALRTAREQYLHLFGKIGTGDVLALAAEIEKEAKEQEAAALAAAAPSTKSDETQGTDSDNKGESIPKADTEDIQQHVENVQNEQGAATEDVPMADAEKSAVQA